jgi:O-antigen/teichoic acid export membrane protein
MSASSPSDVNLTNGKIAAEQSGPLLNKNNRYFETDHLLDNLHGRAFHGGLVTLMGQAVRLLLQVVSAAVLGRLLLPRDFGLLAMVASLTGFIGMFKDLGLSNATIQRAQITHGQISALFWINSALSMGVTIVVACLAPAIAWFYHEPKLVWITLVLSVNFIFGGLTVQHQALLRRQMQFKTTAVIGMISMAAGVITSIIMAALGFRYWSLVGAEFGISITNCLLVWTSCHWRPGMFQRNVGVGPMLTFGGHLTGFTVINYFTRNFDNILIGRVLGPAPLGLYTRAYSLLMMPISQVNAPLAAVLLPGLSRLQDNATEYRKLFLRAVGAMLFVTVPLVVFSAFFAHDVILLWLGSRWLPVARIFRLLAPAAAVGAIVFAPNWLSQTLGRPAQQFHYALISAPVCIAGFLIGIRWGVEGVAISFSITFVGLLWGYVWYATKNSPVRFLDVFMSFLSALTPACIAGVITWAFRWKLLGNADALTTLAVCGPIFLVLCFSIAMLSENSRSLIFGATRALSGIISRRAR